MYTAGKHISGGNLKVSPAADESVETVFKNNKPIEVTYTTSENTISLNGISNAEIIYEYIDKSGKPYYKALFEKNAPNKTHPIVSIENTPAKLLPKFNFVDSKDLPKYLTKPASSIFVTLSYNIFSNFIYEEGVYHHYRDTYKDIDQSNSKPIAVSNVIVQFINPDTVIDTPHVTGSGKGLLFCGGKVLDIKWDKKKDSPIKVIDESGKPVSLIKGKTWWIIVSNNSSVAYN